VGAIEALGLTADKLHLSGFFWNTISTPGDNFGALGYATIALFFVVWLASTAFYK